MSTPTLIAHLAANFPHSCVKATPRKDRLTALHASCLHLFRHIAQILLEIRQYSCVEFVQSAEKSDCAICAQSLCGIALIFLDVHTVRLRKIALLCKKFASQSEHFGLCEHALER